MDYMEEQSEMNLDMSVCCFTEAGKSTPMDTKENQLGSQVIRGAVYDREIHNWNNNEEFDKLSEISEQSDVSRIVGKKTKGKKMRTETTVITAIVEERENDCGSEEDSSISEKNLVEKSKNTSYVSLKPSINEFIGSQSSLPKDPNVPKSMKMIENSEQLWKQLPPTQVNSSEHFLDRKSERKMKRLDNYDWDRMCKDAEMSVKDKELLLLNIARQMMSVGPESCEFLTDKLMCSFIASSMQFQLQSLIVNKAYKYYRAALRKAMEENGKFCGIDHPETLKKVDWFIGLEMSINRAIREPLYNMYKLLDIYIEPMEKKALSLIANLDSGDTERKMIYKDIKSKIYRICEKVSRCLDQVPVPCNNSTWNVNTSGRLDFADHLRHHLSFARRA